MDLLLDVGSALARGCDIERTGTTTVTAHESDLPEPSLAVAVTVVLPAERPVTTPSTQNHPARFAGTPPREGN
jgi:hypothetical protein